MAQSYLFVPGDRPAMLTKARARGADVVVADLEDGVGGSRKSVARSTIAEWLSTESHGGSARWVRFNSSEDFAADVEALVGCSIDGAFLPKSAGPEDVASRLSALQDASLCHIAVPMIETAVGLLACSATAQVPGVARLMIGEADLGADIGMTIGNPAWDSIRLQLVVASAAAGISPPIGPVDPDYSELTSFEKETRHLRSLGFSARAAIHPAQIEPIMRAMAPSAAEIAKATAILQLVEDHGGEAIGAVTGPDGTMVDEAFVRWARMIVAQTEHRDGRGDDSPAATSVVDG